ncbi:MAG: DNA polymerase I [Thermoanaerobaculia bacterium]
MPPSPPSLPSLPPSSSPESPESSNPPSSPAVPSAGAPHRPKLVLIDGFNNIFRAFFAIRSLSNSKGVPTNAVYGFIQILRKLLRDEQPDLVGVALDLSDQTFRTEKYADYKANRAPMPEELRPQIPLVRRAIEAFRIPRLELDNYEADDVMGTLARKGAEAGYDVVLVTADKDMMQLVAPNVALFHSGRNKRYDVAGITEDFGVPPSQVVDVLALMGDAVDNVPGVPGIGEKGAKQLVREYGSVEALLERAAEIPRKAYREGLQQHREQALLSKDLVTIRTDLPIELDPEALRLDPPDVEALRALYAELEFSGLLEELQSTAAVAPAAATGESAPAGASDKGALPAIPTAAAWNEFAARVGSGATFALVAEAETERPIALALSAKADGDGIDDSDRSERSEGGVAGSAEHEISGWVDLRDAPLADAVARSLADWLARPGFALIACDMKEVLRLAWRGSGKPVAPCAGGFDLMLASYLLKPTAHGHSLTEITLERLGEKLPEPKFYGFERGVEPPATGDERVGSWVGARLRATGILAPILEKEIGLARDGALATLYRDIECPLAPVLLRMEEAGIGLDTEFLAAMSTELASLLATLESAIYELAGEKFNIQSPSQLGVILFEKLGLAGGKRTKKTKNWSTDAGTLEDLAAKGNPLPEKVLRYRELAKLKSTYVDALPGMIGADGRLHTHYQQAVAATGRLSSVNPNLQNIPIRTEMGQRIRKAFRAGPGRLLVAADYSQIELRVLAHIAGEKAMIDAFARGEDIHRSTAAAVLGISADLVNGDQRRAAKTINFGLIYGMSAFGLGQALGIPTKEAEQFIAAYFARYAGVQAYMQETLASAERDGCVATLFGRIRPLPDIQSSNWNLRENARRVAINARIQGTAADLQKMAMIAVDRRLQAEHPTSQLLLSVHDELVLETPAEEAAAVAALVQKEMEGVATLAVPLVAEAGIGESWYAAKG